MNQKKITVNKMTQLAADLEKQNTERSSVHHVLLERAYNIVLKHYPQYSDILSPMLKYLLHVVKKPDNKGDYERGRGRHYYCVLNYMGRQVSPVMGYYRNGLGRFGKSARSMLEEDYTMALTMYHAGFRLQASSFLARAVHMISDICCLPHALCMTYYSPSRSIHQAYEKLADYLYPDHVPSVDIPRPLLSFFSDRNSFSASLNSIAECIKDELPLFYSDPQREIIARLYDAEIETAAFLVRFCEDTSMSPEKAHYITEGMICPLFRENSGIVTVHITEKGLSLIHKGSPISGQIDKNRSCRYFSAAHRTSGLFTLSPSRCSTDSVFTDKGCTVFDPRDKNQLFHFIRQQ